MEVKLAENIRIFRKNKRMTQEQLAEALDVTVGAVSKWESAATTPDIGMIIRLAEFFEISLDVLVGYRMQGSTLEQSLMKIKTLREEHNYDEAIGIGEKVLQKFPNNFDAVYQTALSYFFKASGEVRKEIAERAQELFRRSLELFDQNADPEISRWLIKNQLAESYIYLRQGDRAVEIFKENNFQGINNGRIAQVLSDILKRHDEAMPYAKKAFRKMTEDMVDALVALISAYYGNREYKRGEECHDWLLNVLESIEPEQGFCETTPIRITLLQSQAEVFYGTGQREKARRRMIQARRLATAYDAASFEKISTCRFFEGRLEGKNYLDQSSDSMMSYLEKRLHWNTREEEPDYYALWDEVVDEVGKEERGERSL